MITVRVEWVRPLGSPEPMVRAIGTGFGNDAHDDAISRHFEACEEALLGISHPSVLACGVLTGAPLELVCFHDLAALEHLGAFLHLLRAFNETDMIERAA